ncbi:hypothetical protein Dsin_023732 [Dipteronia sinensis]|uniref:Uncharacterized protein n=1 Tax=Dipteronia sinensis TaxID=43782 RepID=A0AAE0A4V3_9ROSI|nr:hypothetical protein Dsin_023732 [Dipteronia sinensis]
MLKRKDIAALVLVFVVFGIQTCFSQNIGRASFPNGFVFGTDSSAFQVKSHNVQYQLGWFKLGQPVIVPHSVKNVPQPQYQLHSQYMDYGRLTGDGHVLNKADGDDPGPPGRKMYMNEFEKRVLKNFPNLVTDLKKKWPSLVKEKAEYFWLHEWDKHGRQQPELQPANYFFTTRDMADRTDLLKALKAEGIVPGHHLRYPIVDIENAITKKIGYKPLLLCYNTNTLSELVICVDAKAQNFAPCKQQKYPNLCAGPHIEFLSV